MALTRYRQINVISYATHNTFSRF